METTEKIVESYCRYVKNWFTLPNIRCKGQYEIDLLAVDTTSASGMERYHIECGISISRRFSMLTANDFSQEQLKMRLHHPVQRRTIGYFIERKFKVPAVLEKLEEFGFVGGNYHKVIVSWDWEPDVSAKASEHDIVLWNFKNLVREIAEVCRGKRTYFTDDTLRTIHLFSRACK